MSSEKAKAARRAYLNRWRSEHREKVKQYNTRYWERVAERMELRDENDCKNGKHDGETDEERTGK